MLTKQKINDIYYYILPIDYKLYKGLSDLSRINNISSYEWYGLSVETAETYGYVYVYKNNKQLKLFAMDEPKNIKFLLQSADIQNRPDVINALNKTFILYNEHDIVVRRSEISKDKIIVEFLCRNNFDGYGSDEMLKILNGNDKFHSEICVCNSDKIISYQNEQIITEKAKTKFINNQPLGKRTHRVIDENTRNKVRRRLFLEEPELPEQEQEQEQEQELELSFNENNDTIDAVDTIDTFDIPENEQLF